MSDVMLLTGAGQIGMAIARRMGYGRKIVVGDKDQDQAEAAVEILNHAGFDSDWMEMDLSSRESILNFIKEAMRYGDISMFINAAGVSPSQASIETILKVDLYGTAALSPEIDEQLATCPTGQLLSLEVLQPRNLRNTLHAYQMAKRCNEKRVMAEAVKWGVKGARINSISPGIVVTPLAMDEFNGQRGEFYKTMFAKCPAGRPGTADEIANVAGLLMSHQGAFITGSDVLIDGGATASYFYGPLRPDGKKEADNLQNHC